METTTIIFLKILSTLCVVTVIALVVVAIFRLGRKIDELDNTVNQSINFGDEELRKDINELHRELDSRCDKLDNKIKISNNTANVAGPVANAKQILQG